VGGALAGADALAGAGLPLGAAEGVPASDLRGEALAPPVSDGEGDAEGERAEEAEALGEGAG
jgi:hypothetical protein